jgi:hypothetical protein
MTGPKQTKAAMQGEAGRLTPSLLQLADVKGNTRHLAVAFTEEDVA